MSVMVFYRSASEHGRDVIDFIRDFERQTAKTLEQIDPDGPRGADMCRLYDVVEYPTLVATSRDGQLLNKWRGLPLPTINEVDSYA